MDKTITKDLRFLYETLEPYNIIGFYHKPWYYLASKLIGFSSGGDADHVGIVSYCHKVNNDKLFTFIEQKFFEGKTSTKYSISPTLIDSRFRGAAKIMYYAVIKEEIRQNITPAIAKKINKYLDSNIGEKYSLSELTFTIRWFIKLLPFMRRRILTNYSNYDEFCSSLVAGVIKILQEEKVMSRDNSILYPLPTPIKILHYRKLFDLYIIK